MISLNGLYTTLREAIKVLTNIEVYQNNRSSPKIVDAKWLFVKVVYYLFKEPEGEMLQLIRPSLDDMAFQLGYKNKEGVTRLRWKYIPKDGDIEWKLELLKYVFTEYVNGNLDKVYIIPFIVQAKYERWLINTFKIIEDEGIQT